MNKAANITLSKDVLSEVGASCGSAKGNLQWLLDKMHSYFAITMQDEPAAVAALAIRLQQLRHEQRLVLADRKNRLIVAKLNCQGSLYETLHSLREREISYAQFTQSYAPIPGIDEGLEVQRFDFERKTNEEIAADGKVIIPQRIRQDIKTALKQHYPGFDFRQFDRILRLIWLNNENYIRVSPAKRTAQALWMYHLSDLQGGIFLDVEVSEDDEGREELRIMFAAGNPPQYDFLTQTMEVFNRLKIGVRRAYCLTISNGVHPYFLGTFYVRSCYSELADKTSALFQSLRMELYNTQILSTVKPTYRDYVMKGVMTGEETSLVNAMIAFCHTNLAHNQPDRFGFEDVERAFLSDPGMAHELVGLFCLRFRPQLEDREPLYRKAFAALEKNIDEYNTGHRYLDDIRRTIFRTALIFIGHTLKTNFFVAEKHALAFRLDPVYIDALGSEFSADLPPDRPFRVTFFFGRHGAGYHIGFSDIARGGWRTVMAHGWDDYVSNANTIFRENYVLAHTQHLKNKDIFEGGSKMVVLLDAADIKDRDLVTRRLYKLQFGFINAFFDIFVTENGKARDPRVVDYYQQDEAIELGPDENMHDSMVELIARQSLCRGYLLGIGIISSKKIGINHKEFGVTSRGVVKFAEIAMEKLGVNVHAEPFSVKFTGGPGGDVAGNAMRLLLERCPQVNIKLILDGTGALFDPQGAKRSALEEILLKKDIESFNPGALSPGGFLLYRNIKKAEGLRDLYKKVKCTDEGLIEAWVTVDEFHREFNSLIFDVSADLFVPAGGRPETIDESNWQNFFDDQDRPSMRVVVEGANSFITPAARIELQKRGVVVLRDASANKCGVISSSYEIIANLLMTEKEFLANKRSYVSNVLHILDQRAEDEVRLIFRRHAENPNSFFTDISDEISREINAYYASLFDFFQERPDLREDQLMRRVVLAHLPKLISKRPRYRGRVKDLPGKYLAAILASEIASSLVYRGDHAANFMEMVKGHISRSFQKFPAA
jgi:glutamate dehydrogenase